MKTVALILICFLSVTSFSCTLQDGQGNQNIFKPETEKINNLKDSANAGFQKISDTAKAKLQIIADSAEANLKRMGDSTKKRLRSLKDSMVDDAVNRVAERVKETIKAK